MRTLQEQLEDNGCIFNTLDGFSEAVHFGDTDTEYQAIRHAVGLQPRMARGLLQVSGVDRAAWLHNLVTNEVRNLDIGAGNYAFALNVKGRILFDLGLLLAEDRVLLDVDRRWTAPALAHLDKYIIMEDVQLEDLSDNYERLGLVGPRCAEACAAFGLPQMTAMAQWQHEPVAVAGIPARAVRNDYCGVPGVELIIESSLAAQAWTSLLEMGQACGLRAVGSTTSEQLRVESGIPAACTDIDHDTIPAETRQLERAVSFNKGCYLGQEVVERMRAHQAVARLWTGLRFDRACDPGATLEHDGQTVGRVTSTLFAQSLQQHIGLGYVRSALATAGQSLQAVHGETRQTCSVADLPFVATT